MTKIVYTKKLGKLVAGDANGPTHGSSVHIIPTRRNKWSIVKNGKVHVVRNFATKESAVSFAKRRAGEIIVHKTDGTISNTFIITK